MKSKNQKSARFLAINALTQLKKTKLPITVILEKMTVTHAVNDDERRLTLNLIYGVLRHYQYLDHLLAVFCRKPLKKLHPTVHQGLRVGLYQILFLDRIPASAAVNETISALKRLKLSPQLSGLANGVLRAIIRQIEQLPGYLELEQQQKLILNHPGWLTERWRDHYGQKQMVQICRSNSKPATLVLRLNNNLTNKDVFQNQLAKQEINVENGRIAPDALVLPGFSGSVTNLPGFENGAFLVQDEGAQLIPFLLMPLTENGQYLDGCAGLGGKTSQLALLGQQYNIKLTATEPQKKRFLQLQANLKRLKIQDQVQHHMQTLEQFSSTNSKTFDGVLLDVPCSGTGVIGRHPDIRWNREESDLIKYRGTQLELLQYGSQIVSKGGILVYATCSLEPEENEQVIEHFLKTNDHFILTDCADVLPEKFHQFVQNKYLRTMPAESIDGFFAARLVRNNG